MTKRETRVGELFDLMSKWLREDGGHGNEVAGLLMGAAADIVVMTDPRNAVPLMGVFCSFIESGVSIFGDRCLLHPEGCPEAKVIPLGIPKDRVH